ncbi:MAG: TldD/PmbA family protein [Eubacteriales bacterium]
MIYQPNEFMDILIGRAVKAGFLQSEVFFENGRSSEVQILDGEVSMYESSTLQGVSFRGFQNGQMGYAFAEELTDDSMDFLLDQAAQNCAVLESEEEETIYGGDPEYGTVDVFSESLDELVFDDFAGTGLALEKKILASDPRIVAVDHCVVSYGSSNSQIRNSLSLNLSHVSNLLFVYANARCEEGDQVKTGDAYWFGRDFENFNIDKLAARVTSETIGKLGASPVPSGRYNVVLDAMAAADLLSTFCAIFSADLIQKGFSLLGDKMNTRIGPEFFTIHDDAIMDKSITAIPFDSEGVATQNKILVNKGVLTGILHNRKTAAKAGTTSTGNGFRSGYRGSVSVGPTNLYIEPGEKDLNSLFLQAENGLYIKELAGLHAGANMVSGDFSLSCEGYVIENGKIGRAVDQVTLADNFYLLINKIISVGSDLYFDPPSDAGSIGSPSLLIGDAAISGD